jgi:hypothetical protein
MTSSARASKAGGTSRDTERDLPEAIRGLVELGLKARPTGKGKRS